MKKQENGKKTLRWFLLAAGLVVLAAAVAFLLILGGNKPVSEPTTENLNQNIKLYWNVEREAYVAKGEHGASGRSVRSDGYYWIRFAVEGEQVDIPVADRDLVDRIDMLDLMGLVLDEEGVVLDVLEVQDFTGGLAADHYYVESIDDATVVCNTSRLFKGVSVSIEVPETANIYNVGGEGLLTGIPGTIQAYDEIIAVKDKNGVITDVFVLPYKIPGDVYWNITRMYDSATKQTTREMNILGYYEYQFAFGGEIVTLKTKDMKIASNIDSYVARCMGLQFDEEGYIIGTRSASVTAGGSVVGSWYYVTGINGSEITMEKISSGTDQGSVATATIGRDCKTVLTTTGEYTEVRLGDLVHCLSDCRGRLAYIFVIGRISETAKVYWNVERQYDSEKKVTKRTPAADGYYYIKLAVDGKQVTLKTKDKGIATSIDSYAARCFALEVEGDEILSVSGTGTATGGSVFASWYHVDSVEDGVVTATKRTDTSRSEYGKTSSKKMASDCKVYDVSTNSMMVGEETTVKVGDQIHCLTNLKSEIVIIFVVNRPVSSKIYYNLTRMYDSEQKVTTREKAEDGYYYFTMAVDGEQVTLKTKDKDIATEVDSRPSRCMGLKLSGDVILKIFGTSSVKGYTGGVEVSYCDVISINGRTVIAERTLSGDDQGKKYTVKMTSNCEVFDVSGAYTDHAGEYTTLRIGDRIHCLMDENKNTALIYVVSRKVQGVVGWNVTRKYDSVNKTTTRTPNADGWYYIDMAIDGQIRTLKTQNIEQINAIDSNPAMCRGLILDGDVIKRVVSPSMVIGTDGGINGSWVTVTEVNANGCKAVKMGGTENGTTYDIPMAKNCKVYNVSSTVKDHVGEVTTVKYGAIIHVLINTDGDATIIYVISEGVEGAFQGHCNVCNKDVTWAKWDGTGAMVGNVHYYLDKDIHLDTYVTLSGVNATLFLNGHTITSDSRVFRLQDSATLTIYDSKADGSDIGGKIIGKGLTAEEAQIEQNGASEGGVIMMWNSNVTLNLYSGTLALAQEHNAVKNGGVVAGAGIFNMYGGSVIGGTVTNQGGSVRIFGSKAVFNLYDGTVTGGQAKNGGNIDATSGATVNIKGGTVSGGIAINGTADVYGGNLYLNKAAANVTGGTITGGEAPHGGNIAVTNQSSLKMTTGTVSEGKAITLESVGNGGNLYVSAGSTGTVTGGTITGGQARRGGNLAVFGTATVQNVTLDAGWANLSGKCIFNYNNGDLTLADVTIPASSSGTSESINHSGRALTLAGKVVVPQIYLSDAVVTIGEGGLADDSSIGIRDGNIATGFATVPEDADKDCFYSTNTLYTVRMDENKKLYLRSGHVHCECGGQAQGVGDHTDCEDLEWTAWTSTTSLPTTSGNYYLTADVNMSGTTTAVGSDIKLCLNGHQVNNSARIWLKGDFTVTDCTGTGAIVSSVGNKHTAMFYTRELCELRLYAGTLDGSGAGQGSGVISLCTDDTNGDSVREPSAFYMYGGTVKGRNAGTAIGGAIWVMLETEFRMYGGTITGGQASKGGAVYVANNGGIVDIQGGTITGNKSDLGGAIYLATAASSISISGDVNITGNTNAAGTAENNIYLITGRTLTLGTLAETARIGISMATAGTVAENVADVTANIISDNAAYTPVYDEAAQKISLGSSHTSHIHCVCADGANGLGTHECDDTASWTALTQDMFDNPDGTVVTKTTVDVSTARAGVMDVYTLAAGNYYLAEDITVDYMIQVNGTDVSLCLNNKTFTSNSRAFRIAGGGTVNITDCGENGQVVAKGITEAEAYEEQNGAVEGGAVMLWGSSYINFYGGTVRLASVDEGGISNIKNGGVISGNGQIVMYGGTVSGGRATGSGGNIRLWNSGYAKYTMYGGSVENGKATNGGNIAIDGSATATPWQMNLNGGTVSGGEATSKGGNIYVNNGALTISGATVENGKATYSGGNLLVNSGTATMTDGIVSNGQSQEGGNFHVIKGSLLVSGGTVTGGKALTYHGGNICTAGAASGDVTVTVNGNAVIEKGKANKKGGNIYIKWTDKLNLGGNATVTEGQAGINGGGITCYICKPTISGNVKITGNVGSDLQLDGNTDSHATIILDGLGTEARIGVSMTTVGTFASNVTTDLSGCFVSNDENYEVKWEGNALILKAKTE